MAQNSEDELDKTIVSGSDTFNGRVRAADDSPPTLVVLIGPAGYVGKQFALTEQEHILGRSIDCQIYIDDKSVSRNHARFEVTGKDVLVQDLGSSNKTYINNEEHGRKQEQQVTSQIDQGLPPVAKLAIENIHPHMPLLLQGIGRTQHEDHGVNIDDRFLQRDGAGAEQIAHYHDERGHQYHSEC